MQGSFLTPLQEGRDTVLIADQMLYGVELQDVQEGTGLFFPEIRQEEGQPGVMVLSDWRLDTLDVRRQKKGLPKLYDIRAGIVVTSFNEGRYALPPISVERHSPDGTVDTLSFDPLVMEVAPVQIDTTTFQLHDIKGQIRYPLTFRELLEHRDPAHIVALRKLDTYRGDRLWAPEKQKAFYSGVTDALREYIVSRYGISAMEMTTKEIFEDLKGTDVPQDLFSELQSLFERADYVKFAKYVASDEENASAVPLAVRFVTTTYQSEVNAESAQERQEQDGQKQDGQKQNRQEQDGQKQDGQKQDGQEPDKKED